MTHTLNGYQLPYYRLSLWRRDQLGKYYKKMMAFGPTYFLHIVDFKFNKKLYKKDIISKERLLAAANRYHRYIYAKTMKLISPVVEKYTKTNQIEKRNFSRIVWVMWMQGLDSAPEIVKLCVNSIKKNSGYSDVRVISDSNIGDYLDIPSEILEGLNSGRISRALYSDYIRFKVLSRYGGVWLDSTCFCSGPLPSSIEQLQWSSAKGIESFIYDGFPSEEFPYMDQWVSYFVSSTPNSLFSNFVSDALEYYMTAGFPLTDYFLVFYIAKIARENIQQIGNEFRDIAPNNTKCEQMWQYLDSVSDDKVGIDKVQSWLRENDNTVIYKLSYRRFGSDAQKRKYINIIGKIEEL